MILALAFMLVQQPASDEKSWERLKARIEFRSPRTLQHSSNGARAAIIGTAKQEEVFASAKSK